MKNYKNLKSAYSKEKFFVSYAVNGPIIDPSRGIRQGMPDLYPISGPVREPSPLNTRYIYEPPTKSTGIL